MSDLMVTPVDDREPLQVSSSDAANPVGLDGIEFIEYSTTKPQALGQVLEMIGFKPVARHRSREVLLYRQGALNIVVNAHPAVSHDVASTGATSTDTPVISAVALRVRDARAAYAYVRERGAWDVPTRAEVMELNIPGIHGAGGSRIYFVDRYREFSIYDVDFVAIPGVDQHPPAMAGLHFFGIVQYIGVDRSYDWIEFYKELFGFELIPDEERFGIMPSGKLLRSPAVSVAQDFMLQLVEPHIHVQDASESLKRLGLGVPDVPAAVKALRQLGIEFVESDRDSKGAGADLRGALTKIYLGSVAFELVHSDKPAVNHVVASARKAVQP